MINTRHRFVGAMMTELLVGREQEQAAIRHATGPEAGDAFQLIVLIASGGIGKTRLLRETCWQLGAPSTPNDPLAQLLTEHQRTWARDRVLCLPLLDVAEPRFHDQVALLRQVRRHLREAIDPQDGLFFEVFDQALRNYETRQGERSYAEIQVLRSEVVRTFEQDYAELTRQFRVVWVIDTVEQLFGVEPKIEALLHRIGITEDDIGQTTYSWLMDFVKERPANTTLLLAGRPTPPRWWQDIRDRAGEYPGFTQLEVKPLEFVETEAYFAALSKQLDRDEFVVTARYLKELIEHSERTQAMHFLTRGNPILLALYIDMITSVTEEPEEFHRSLAELQALTGVERENLQRSIEAKLLDYIESGIGHPENTALQYLFITRRGLNARRLQRLLGGTKTECAKLLDHLRRLSFVKVRLGKVYLHDELYTIYARRLVTLPPAQREAEQDDVRVAYHAIIQYCVDQIKHAGETLQGLQQREQLTDEERELRRDRRQAQRRYKTEQLHYELYLDPHRGFNQNYYILAEQAIASDDVEIDSYLQPEIDLFFFGTTSDLSQQLTETSDDAWALLRLQVAEERASRWVKRLRQFHKVKRAQIFAQCLIAEYDTVIAPEHRRALALRQQAGQGNPHALFDAVVEAYHCFAAIRQGADLREAIRDLEKVIPQIEAELRRGFHSDSTKTRFLNIVAQCFAENGYAYASIGSFQMAIDRYKKAEHILQRTGHETLYAEVKNDLSRVVGDLGNYHKAEGYCQEGLAIRERLGFDIAVGLSLNTQSLIRVRNHRPTTAIAPATEALRRFARLNNPRGMMLASIQLAEANRRAWGLAPDQQKLYMLERAEQLLQQAQEMFVKEYLQENVRQIFTYLEMGCLYRDWAWFLHKQGDQERSAVKFEQAKGYLEQAQDFAKEYHYESYTLDTAVNRAYLYAYCRTRDEALPMIFAALAIAPQAYVFTKQRPLDLNVAVNLAVFQQLSKLYSLWGDLLDEQGDFERALEYRVLQTTYSQLFSDAENWEHYYLGSTLSILALGE